MSEDLICTECNSTINTETQFFELPAVGKLPKIVRCYNCARKYMCKRCNGLIAVRVYKKVKVDDTEILFHTDCYRCDSCAINLGRTGTTERIPDKLDVHLWCDTCKEKDFRGICFSCKKSCRGDFSEALDKQWHKACFKCQGVGCNATFPSGNFYPVNDLPHCMDCAKKLQKK
eukprot:TRINITY_DN2253_c0_g1_i1.p1 TRINITY_DN2253_c0_g1~~TRINITY_DN2253_c0_g1_i1.p1  ORF type:complete len:173 (+),score=26.97 TRINITY_DN2253_c0_g1_i1:32-550(+)